MKKKGENNEIKENEIEMTKQNEKKRKETRILIRSYRESCKWKDE